MWRVQIIYGRQNKSKLDYWQQWMKEKDEKKELGWNVSNKIRKLVAEQIDQIKIENHRLQRENEILSDVKEQLEKMGIKNNELFSYRVREKIKEIETGIPNGLLNFLDQTIKNLTEVRKRLE